MELREIFENKVKIESNVISIESLFNNPDRLKETDYRPSYQRNYVWDDEKATYFIESILLGTEIPPLVYFVNEEKTEIIDGRQRYETILRFLGNNFKLKKRGLQKLDNIGIAGKSFKDLESSDKHSPNLAELFWDTKLRIIEFSFHSMDGVTKDIEEKVKKEIFKRYNSGITPLRQTEIAKAEYLDDDLNTFFRNKISNDHLLSADISKVFHFEKPDIELTLKTIRSLLVLHNIPIKYYTTKKQSVISRFYDNMYGQIDSKEIEDVFAKFVTKLNLLLLLRTEFMKADIPYNRLVSECYFWLFSILEADKFSLDGLKGEIEGIVKSLNIYFKDNQNPFLFVRSSFAKELFTRYELTTKYFAEKFNIDFSIYLYNNDQFKQQNKERSTYNSEIVRFEELRINKPEPSSIAIVDICRLMARQRFLIRPPYQRNEVINKKKSSSIIESILLGIKLPPIFVLKREDGTSEVLDGQQRLLSILGYIGESYLNECNDVVKSDKHEFALNLKSSILTSLHGRKFSQLTPIEQRRIKNFNLWIIEINQKINQNFEPVDLFLRLNNKPYPIKDDTFEMWNSSINRDIVNAIKSAYTNNKDWFYIRKASTRMDNENFYTSLAYFQYMNSVCVNKADYEHDGIDIYRIGNRINFRVKSKYDITKTLELSKKRHLFINAINIIEFDFIRKLQELLITPENDKTGLNKKLDDLLTVEKGKRTQQSMYALWYFLFDIPLKSLLRNKEEIKESIKSLFAKMANVESKEIFISAVEDFKNTYGANESNEMSLSAPLTNISAIQGGISYDLENDKSSIDIIPTYIGDASNTIVARSEIGYVNIADPNSLNKCNVLVKKQRVDNDTLTVLFSDQPIIFNNEFIGISNIRSGFTTAYIYCLLSSRYIHKTLSNNNILISNIRNIQVQITTAKVQEAFNMVFNCFILLNTNSVESLFFKQLMDVMICEVYYTKEFSLENVHIIDYIYSELVGLANKENLSIEEVENIYLKIADSSHIIPALLTKVLSLNLV